MATITDQSGRQLVTRGAMGREVLQRHLAHQRSCAAAARKARVRRRGDGKGNRSQQRRQAF